jgi:hypothetical protein
MPAQAASFSLSLGGPGFGFGLYPMKPGITLHFGDPNYYLYCMTDKQVVKYVNRQDEFSHTKIAKYQNKYNRVWVITYDEDNEEWVQARVGRCDGEIDHIRPIDYDPDFPNKFSLSLNF